MTDQCQCQIVIPVFPETLFFSGRINPVNGIATHQFITLTLRLKTEEKEERSRQ
jgi:hypothetical protein